MQFIDRTGKTLVRETPAAAAAPSVPPYNLSFYSESPCNDVTLEQFERLALDRLTVLQKLRDEKELKKAKEKELQDVAERLMNTHMKESTTHESELKDVCSHYILRLAYCRTPSLREELLRLEAELFRARFGALLASQKVQFMREAGVACEDVGDAELADLKDDLAAVAAAIGERDNSNAIRQGKNRTFFKVPWERVYDLVERRQVLLRKGYAYISKEQVTSLVAGEFRKNLSKGLTEMSSRMYSRFASEEGHRLVPIVEAISSRNLASDHAMSDRAARGEAVTAAQLPSLSQRHFPLCMWNLHEHLRVDHHLKHQGRQHLNLFFKSIGLSMEDAINYWRQHFAPRTPHEAFNKQYAYAFRHNYGREGKRADYTPHKCISIISQKVDPGTHHGCPYKTFSDDELVAALRRLKCSERGISEVKSKRAGGHYQLACQSAFEGIHNCACLVGVNYPNQYYDESRRVTEEKEGGGSQSGTQGTASGVGTPGTSGMLSQMDTPGVSTPSVSVSVSGVSSSGTPSVSGVKRRPDGTPLQGL